MYTVPKPSNGAPTAMSGEERQNGVTSGTVGPTYPQPCAPATEPSTALTPPGQVVFRPSGNGALQLKIKTGTTGHPVASFYMSENRSKEGSDLPKVTKQVNVSGRPTLQIPDRWLMFIFPYYSAFHLPYNLPSRHLYFSCHLPVGSQKQMFPIVYFVR